MEEDWRDVLLYLCGNLAEMEAIFQIPPISLSSDEGIRLTEAVFFLLRAYKKGYYQKKGLGNVEASG